MSITQLLKNWLPTAFIVTILSGTTYVAAQQVLRQSANDPQTQIAEDLALKFANGLPIAQNVPVEKVELSESLSPFVMVFNSEGKLATSTATLNGQVSSIPSGVISYTLAHGLDRVTWQPESGIRMATVALRYHSASDSGVVVVGRSLRETETRVDQLTALVALGWATAIFGSFVLMMMLASTASKAKK